METFSGKISASTGFSKDIYSGFEQEEEEEYYYDDDDTKFVKSRLAIFLRGELIVRMNLLGTYIARDGPDSSYFGALKV